MIINGINRVRGFELVKDAPADTMLPIKGSNAAAGYDFYAPCDIYVPCLGHSKLIPLNIKAYMQQGEHLEIHIRSSLAVKHHLQVEQGTAIIDSDYYSNPNNDGNIGVMFFNKGSRGYTIYKGERCCQGIFVAHLDADNVESLGNRIGGYGSSGK